MFFSFNKQILNNYTMQNFIYTQCGPFGSKNLIYPVSPSNFRVNLTLKIVMILQKNIFVHFCNFIFALDPGECFFF